LHEWRFLSMAQLPLGLRFAPDQRLGSYRDAPPGLLALLAALLAGDATDSIVLSGASGAG
jgi:hypothetical protein